MEFRPTRYQLRSVASDKIYEDSGWMLDEPGAEVPTLIRAEYSKKQLRVYEDAYGVFRFADWLPVRRYLTGSSAPVTYKSQALASHLGLDNLFITFSGYWPEKGAFMRSCSFKETEAYAVCGRLADAGHGVLVVASAGNTARAFARVCSDNKIPLLLSVPADNLDALWFERPLDPCVVLVCTEAGSDYYDAINLSNRICEIPGFFAEGGARNVARRDGMGTTVLSAAHVAGHIPEYYYQAVGSGTGAIAAWEANLRLVGDGRYGNRLMKLIVSQNTPFLPIYDAWQAGSRKMLPLDDTTARKQVEKIEAKVLSNRKPPYPVCGGLFDALKATEGKVLKVTNEESADAAALFEKLEGCDIHPAAAVATASLLQDVYAGAIPLNASIMLNITGGGEDRFKKDHTLQYLQPSYVFPIDAGDLHIREVITSLFP